MYIIGYIDDENDMIADYVKRLSRRDIDLRFAPKGSMKIIKQWIVDENIECMIIDYRLKANYDFMGTELFSYLNDELPGLPCIIMTSFTDDSVNENLVVKNCIFDRSKMSDEFEEFCEMLKQSAEVFKTKKCQYMSKYTKLYQKKRTGTITHEEEEELVSVFKILRSYGEVDDISAELLTTALSSTLDKVLVKLDELLKK